MEIKSPDLFLVNRMARDNHIESVEVLDEVKPIQITTIFVTLNQVADYFSVNAEDVKKTYYQFKKEFLEDGCTSLKGKVVLDYFDKNDFPNPDYPPYNLIAITKKGLLRFAMLLEESETAHGIREVLYRDKPQSNRLDKAVSDYKKSLEEVVEKVQESEQRKKIMVESDGTVEGTRVYVDGVLQDRISVLALTMEVEKNLVRCAIEKKVKERVF